MWLKITVFQFSVQSETAVRQGMPCQIGTDKTLTDCSGHCEWFWAILANLQHSDLCIHSELVFQFDPRSKVHKQREIGAV